MILLLTTNDDERTDMIWWSGEGWEGSKLHAIPQWVFLLAALNFITHRKRGFMSKKRQM